MDEVDVAGQVILSVNDKISSMDYIAWKGRCWLVPRWATETASGFARPLRLVAPRIAPRVKAPKGPEILQVF